DATNEKEQEAFLAILGTPIGEGVAKLIGQHREQLRSLQVKSISIFCDDCTAACPEPYVIFRVEDDSDDAPRAHSKRGDRLQLW
ncbi:hypothetical protein DOTSEDRAFT_75409, partial [Dothistroma septosporum NZE10]